jgi:Ca2+/Na+ antiporter
LNDIKLYDIKPIMEIPDNSLSILVGIVVALLLFVVLVVYFLYKKRKKLTKERRVYRLLTKIDLSDTKNSAYLITKYSRVLATTESLKNIADELDRLLSEYKYKKETPPFSDEVVAKYHLFVEMLDV